MKVSFFRQFLDTYADRQVQFHSAALAFYMIIALPAFFVFFLSVAGIFISTDILHIWLTASGFINPETLMDMSKRILQFSSITAVFSMLIMIWSGSAIFNRVQHGLRDMWQVELNIGKGVRKFFANKLLAVIAALIFIVGIVGLFIFTQVATIFLTSVISVLPMLPSIISVAQLVQFLLLVSVLVMVYALFGDSRVSFPLLLIGSSTVSFILLIFQFVFQSYVAQLAAVSWYGAAGYIVILLFSLYFVGVLFYSGAILMHVVAENSKRFSITPRSYAYKTDGNMSIWDKIKSLF